MAAENEKTIPQRVKEIVHAHLGLPDTLSIMDTSHIVDDLGADSLDTVELIMAFEEQFSITIPDTVSEKVETIADAIEVVTAFVDGSKLPDKYRDTATRNDLGLTPEQQAKVDAIAADHDNHEEQPAVLPGMQLRYFILKPGSRDQAHAEASVAGIRAYAESIRPHNTTLADELLLWLNEERPKNVNDTF